MPDITIAASDGGSFGAYLASPSSGSGPGVVVIQEIFGVNRVMRDICDGLAADGYIACAPDLFWRQEPGVQLTDKTEAEWEKAFGYLQGFDFEKGVADIAATIGHVRGLGGCSGKVGTVGYCMGGSLAYMSACFTDSDASVGYYPVQIEGNMDKAEGASKPAMLHIAAEDDYCPPEAQKTSPGRARRQRAVHRPCLSRGRPRLRPHRRGALRPGGGRACERAHGRILQGPSGLGEAETCRERSRSTSRAPPRR